MYAKKSLLEDTPPHSHFEDLADIHDYASVNTEEIKCVHLNARNFSDPGVNGIIKFW